MTGAAPLLDRLRAALREAHVSLADAPLADASLADAPLEMMADKGLAHHHVHLAGTGVIARLPKQSQMGLDPQDNLDYQAACYQRAGGTGAVPLLLGVLAPSDPLPRGGLLVQEIVGRAARLPDDLNAIARALAAMHALPLPRLAQRAPLRDDPDPLRSLWLEIEAQAQYLDSTPLPAASRQRIEAQRQALRERCQSAPRPLRRLISFDAHPGNFVVRDDGSAVLVDLEKARYSYPPLDLAHATLYTSTTWDLEAHAELSLDQVEATYATWAAAAKLGPTSGPWWVPLRAAMWLWSVTWCAKWRALSPREANAGADGEDWSQQHSEAALVAHVRDRVECYLSASVIERVVDEFAALERRFAAR